MKFFTLNWWRGGVDDPMRVNDLYCDYVKSVRKSLPPDLWKLFWELSLHDSHLRQLAFADRTLQMTIVGERRPRGNYLPGKRRFSLTYHDVRSFKTLQHRASLGGPPGYGDLGYDEIEFVDHGIFEHRMLFSSGIELKIVFGDFSIAYKDLAH